jgi:crotonobetainyl-CoA:carnitine CoA-transferase CaiB-like acyl-CoA transferase
MNALRILDLGTMVAGPAAATFLSDFGADVIKVEQPNGGDTLRGLGPFKDGESLWWQVEGRNKRSITLDLRQAEGQALLKRLVAQADALVENFRPGTMEKWHLGYDTLAAANPRLVMLSVSGFGQSGPFSQRAGYDRMGLAYSGVMNITGYPDRPPVRVGVSLADYSTATFGAYALMMALYKRDVDGGPGQHIDLSMYEALFRFTDTLAIAYDQLGRVRRRTGNVHQAAAPGNNFATKDGRFIVLTISGDTVFRKLCQAMGRPELADDPRHANHELRFEHVEALNGAVAEWIAATEVPVLCERLDAHGVPYSLIMSVQDIFEDPHYAARESLITVEHPRLGPLRMQGVVPKLSATPSLPPQPAPDLGADNEAVYMGLLGMTRNEFDSLRSRKVI